jgi:hypothetical protein
MCYNNFIVTVSAGHCSIVKSKKTNKVLKESCCFKKDNEKGLNSYGFSEKFGGMIDTSKSIK